MSGYDDTQKTEPVTDNSMSNPSEFNDQVKNSILEIKSIVDKLAVDTKSHIDKLVEDMKNLYDNQQRMTNQFAESFPPLEFKVVALVNTLLGKNAFSAEDYRKELELSHVDYLKAVDSQLDKKLNLEEVSRPIQMEDILVLSYSVSDADTGEVAPELSREWLIGSVGPNDLGFHQLEPEFLQPLIGKNVGDEVDAQSTIPAPAEGTPSNKFSGKKLNFKFKVIKVKQKVKPPQPK